ncbi:MAG TPA: sigma 54-interacting transcriptional regulator [Gemmatimonadaceae bacterium]|nr:sigma 54-interacting transcriptional regulator [Gemmatimonadaceae bacterium]
MPSETRVLVLDADEARARSLVELLGPAGFVASSQQLGIAPNGVADVVLLSTNAIEPGTVARVAAALPDADLLVLAQYRPQPMAHQAMRAGACDVVERTAGPDVLLAAIERAAANGRNRRELAALRARVGDEARLALVGQSPGMSLVRELVGRAAGSRRMVLVTGEAGTGKSTVARLVHALSDRAAQPFVVARCEGVDAASLEAELFGAGREGLLETARGGTLVLDEAGTLPRGLWARVSAAIGERAVHRDDVSNGAAVDVRLVLTVRTSDHEASQHSGGLLDDRQMLPISLPPLRERRRDIPLLVQHFRERAAQGRGTLPAIGSETMTPLLAHQWPGNVRELEHWVERIALAANGKESPATRRPVVGPGAEFASIDEARLTLDALERRYILHVLAQESGHQSRAADRLGIDRRTLYRKLREYRDDGVNVPFSR